MLFISSLGSGSRGNAVIVGNDNCKILVDCGFTLKNLAERMLSVGVTPYDLDAIVLTHEHNDHIKGIQELSNKIKLPLYLPERTYNVLKNKFSTGNKADGVPLQYACPFKCPTEIEIKGIKITPFRTSHDAVYPVGYAFCDSDSRAVYATDLGGITPSVDEAATGADLILIESNYDFNMLRVGKYPAYLKARIQGIKGHLSNTCCAEFVAKLYNSGTKNFILGHISQQNNLPELAYVATTSALSKVGATYGKDYCLHICEQDQPSKKVYCSYEKNKNS